LNPARATLTRVLSEPSFDSYPVWTPNGQRLFFSSTRGGQRNIFTQAADGTGIVQRLTESNDVQFPTSLSPDGKQLIFTQTASGTKDDVMMLSLSGSARPEVRPLIQTPAAERNGEVSPDGRWLAYESDESGRPEIYVRSFPDAGHRTPVSASGGTRPLWARSGRELFYLSPTGALMRVGVEAGSTWAATAPAELLAGSYLLISANQGRTYDISPDASRFLIIKEDASIPAEPQGLQLVVVQNWPEELKRRVPTR
jgi:eukaryotic-like serine/threonine-protein kinase